MNPIRMAFGWLCFQAVLRLPIKMHRAAYRWMLAHAGFYAYAPSSTDSKGRRE